MRASWMVLTSCATVRNAAVSQEVVEAEEESLDLGESNVVAEKGQQKRLAHCLLLLVGSWSSSRRSRLRPCAQPALLENIDELTACRKADGVVRYHTMNFFPCMDAGENRARHRSRAEGSWIHAGVGRKGLSIRSAHPTVGRHRCDHYVRCPAAVASFQIPSKSRPGSKDRLLFVKSLQPPTDVAPLLMKCCGPRTRP